MCPWKTSYLKRFWFPSYIFSVLIISQSNCTILKSSIYLGQMFWNWPIFSILIQMLRKTNLKSFLYWYIKIISTSIYLKNKLINSWDLYGLFNVKRQMDESAWIFIGDRISRKKKSDLKNFFGCVQKCFQPVRLLDSYFRFLRNGKMLFHSDFIFCTVST